MNDKRPTITHVVASHRKDGVVWYELLIDGRYWQANRWEYEMIQQGLSPEDLGMIEQEPEQ